MLTILFLSLLIIVALIGACILFLNRHSYPAATYLYILSFLVLAGLAFTDIHLLLSLADFVIWQKIAVTGDVLLAVCLYFYTKTIFRDNAKIYLGFGFWASVAIACGLLVYVVVTPLNQLIFAPDFAQEKMFFLTDQGFGVYLLLMVFLVFGLVQLERTFTGLHSLQRWRVKIEIIGSGLLLASCALYYSHSLLYRSINLSYLELLVLAALAAIALVCYSRLFRDKQGGRLALSRGIAHRSFVLLIVGGYLIILGIVGEGLRYLNVSNAKPVFYIILIVGSLGLVGVFVSEKSRRKFKVILHKNFYQSKYDYRDQWERFVKKITVSDSLAELQQGILDLFCEPLACKGAALYLHDSETGEYTPSATFSLTRDWRPFPLSDPLVEKLQRKNWIVNMREENPDLDGSMIHTFGHFGIFLIVPMFFDEDLAGFVFLAEQINPEELTYEDFDLLRMLAGQSIATIQGLRLSEQLTATRELAAIGKVATFVLHDLKNQVSGLSLMLDNAREYLTDPEFQKDMLETIGNTVTNMNGLILRLKNLKEKPALVVATVNLEKIVNEAVETAGGHITAIGEPVEVAADDEEIYRVILNLLVNALEASADGHAVAIEYGRASRQAFVRVTDKGCGMTAEFIEEKLFKPFATTKKHGFGIGLYQCRQIMEAHGGRIDVVSQPEEGTTFTLLLPLAGEAYANLKA